MNRKNTGSASKHFNLTIWLLFVLIVIAKNSLSQNTNNGIKTPDKTAVQQQLNNQPLLFTENCGQVNIAGKPRPDILFSANSRGMQIFITANAINYKFNKDISANDKHLNHTGDQETRHLNISLVGANPTPVVQKEQQDKYAEIFYQPQYPKGLTAHTYRKMILKNVYPGIDWVIYTKGQVMEYDFVVHAGANPDLIRFKVQDADSTGLSANGDLRIHTHFGVISQKSPVSFVGNDKVDTRFLQAKDGTYCFAIGAYNKAQTLLIDPEIVWSTFYDGEVFGSGFYSYKGNYFLFPTPWKFSVYSINRQDYYQYDPSGGNGAVAADATGNVYLGGTYGGIYGDAAIPFVVKFNAAGSRLWAMYYGYGTGDGLAVTNAGDIYLCGATDDAVDFATPGCYQPGIDTTSGYRANKYTDAYLAKFNTNGVRQWGTYFGGNGMDEALTCAVDASGNVAIAGNTSSTNGISFNGFQNTYVGTGDLNSKHDESNMFLAKFSSAGSRLWATYYGGAYINMASSCAFDPAGNVYLLGNTSSPGLATATAHKPVVGSAISPVLAKFSSGGSRLWATYYGHGQSYIGYTLGYGCIADALGNVYMCGATRDSSGIATPGAFLSVRQIYGGFVDGFLVKFDGNGTRQWGTYIGTDGSNTGAYSCTTNTTGDIYTTGFTFSGNYIYNYNNDLGFQPVKDPFYDTTYQGNNFFENKIGNSDVFLEKFSNGGNRIWGTYYGKPSHEYGLGVVANGSTVYLYGNYWDGENSTSSGLVSNGYQVTHAKYDYFGHFLANVNDFSIQQPTAASYTLCSGDVIGSVTFTTIGTYHSDNIFKLELSNAGGVFAAVPPVIGTAAGSGSITFADCQVPPGTPPGNYVLRITSSAPAGKFLITTITISVTQPADIASLSISKTSPTSCSATNGTITFSGLQPNIIYLIKAQKSGGSGINYNSLSWNVSTNASGAGTVTGLAAGKYFNFSFAPSGFCPASYSGVVTLFATGGYAVPITTNSPVCIGQAFYMDIPTPASGSTISWDGPGTQSYTSQNIRGTNALIGYKGIWTVSVSRNGCTFYGSVDFRVYKTPSIYDISFTSPSACGANDGTIFIAASPRPDTGYISYDLNGVTQPATALIADGSGTYNLTGLGAGTYTNIKLAIPGGHCSTVSPATIVFTTPIPTSLGYNDVQPTSVELNWQAQYAALSGWDIYVSTSQTAPDSATLPTFTSATTIYTVSGLAAGTRYYAWVRSDCGSGSLSAWSQSVTFVTPPANDDATGATPIAVGAACSGGLYTNVGATQPANLEPLASCNQTTPGYSTVWFSFVAPSSGTARVSTDISGGSLADTRLAVFSATDVNDYSTFHLVACDEDNGTVVNGASVAYAVGLTPNATYYVQVGGSQLGAEGTFCVTVNDLSSAYINSIPLSCLMVKTPVGSNADYTGPVCIVDNNSKLVAIAQSIDRSAASEYVASYTINPGSLRSTGTQSTYYLGRNYYIRNAKVLDANVSFFFLASELSKLANSDASATLNNLKVSGYTDSVCTLNYNPDTATTHILQQTSSGSANDVKWVNVTTPLTSNFFIHGSTPLLFNYAFVGNGNWSDTSQWLNNLVPPNPLTLGKEITINPIATGNCVLNIPQRIIGAKLTVVAGKKLVIPGALKLQ